MAIIGIAFAIKVPSFFMPITGHFGSYQAINGMMAWTMLQEGFPAYIIPRAAVLINGQPGLHLLYYPFAALAAACGKTLFGLSLDFWGHFQAAAWIGGASVLFYASLKKRIPDLSPEMALFFFSFAPMALIYGTVFQNEAAGLFFLTASFYFIAHEKRSLTYIVISGILFSLALIARLHFLLAGGAWLWEMRSNESIAKFAGKLSVFTIAMSVGLCAWYGSLYFWEIENPHVITAFWSQLGEGRVFVSEYLTNPAYYLRVLNIMLGEWGTPVIFLLMLVGLRNATPSQLSWILWLAGTLLAIFLFPKKVSDHPFYLISALPPACVAAARGWTCIKGRLSGYGATVIILGFMLFSARFYLPPVFNKTEIERQIPSIGREVMLRTRPEDKIIAQYGSSAELLYYTERYGWPFDLHSSATPSENQYRVTRFYEEGLGDPIRWLEKLRKEGADYLVISEPQKFESMTEFYSYVKTQYREIEHGDIAISIYNLRTKGML